MSVFRKDNVMVEYSFVMFQRLGIDRRFTGDLKEIAETIELHAEVQNQKGGRIGHIQERVVECDVLGAPWVDSSVEFTHEFGTFACPPIYVVDGMALVGLKCALEYIEEQLDVGRCDAMDYVRSMNRV